MGRVLCWLGLRRAFHRRGLVCDRAAPQWHRTRLSTARFAVRVEVCLQKQYWAFAIRLPEQLYRTEKIFRRKPPFKAALLPVHPTPCRSAARRIDIIEYTCTLQ